MNITGLGGIGATEQEYYKKILLKRIKKDFKKSWTALKKDILKTVKYGVSDYFNSKEGYEIFYTTNVNYGGGGKGFYANVRLKNKFIRVVKLSK